MIPYEKIIDIGSDSISSSKEMKQNISPKCFICSLCYCLAYNGSQCNNRKCMKVFCGECMFKQRVKFTEADKREFKCPFCQTFSGFSQIDNEIFEYMNSFKFYCNKSKNCREEYTYDQIVNDHQHKILANNNNNIERCYVCKILITDSDLNTLKCNLCNNIGCFNNISYNAIKIDNPLNKNNNKNKNNNIINKINACIQRCYVCYGPICKYCSKKDSSEISNIICDDCNEKKCSLCGVNQSKIVCIICRKIVCESCSEKCESCGFILCKDKRCINNKISSCQRCMKIASTISYYNCFHKDLLNCEFCFPKCFICKYFFSDIICKCCFKPICIKNCSVKCKSCQALCCNKCSLVCSICKKIVCSNCANYCSECDKNNSLISCKNCNSNVIKKCEFNGGCNRKLCISCWNACNYCGIIFCSKHSSNCSNCEDNICDKHFAQCKKCLNEDELKYIKLCFKKCILKCSFCNIESTVLCKKENHNDNFVYNFGCKHNICDRCVKRCETCGKIVRKCLECIDYFYELCKFCHKYQCLGCSKKCNVCDEAFCSLKHKCNLCKRDFASKCYNCEIIKRSSCVVCKKKLKMCENCKGKYICDLHCYVLYKNEMKKNKKDEHLCQMFICEEHLNEFIW